MLRLLCATAAFCCCWHSKTRPRGSCSAKRAGEPTYLSLAHHSECIYIVSARPSYSVLISQIAVIFRLARHTQQAPAHVRCYRSEHGPLEEVCTHSNFKAHGLAVATSLTLVRRITLIIYSSLRFAHNSPTPPHLLLASPAHPATPFCKVLIIQSGLGTATDLWRFPAHEHGDGSVGEGMREGTATAS